jgi:hypothetical protein
MNAITDKIWVSNNLNNAETATALKQKLMALVGVLQVQVNPAEHWLEVEHEDFTDTESITATLAAMGYKVAFVA